MMNKKNKENFNISEDNLRCARAAFTGDGTEGETAIRNNRVLLMIQRNVSGDVAVTEGSRKISAETLTNLRKDIM